MPPSLRKPYHAKIQNTNSNENRWRIAATEKVKVQTMKLKWSWDGNTLRRPNEDIARMALDWNSQVSRGRGRPSSTWRRRSQGRRQGVERSEGLDNKPTAMVAFSGYPMLLRL